jgi:hypothetical protein
MMQHPDLLGIASIPDSANKASLTHLAAREENGTRTVQGASASKPVDPDSSGHQRRAMAAGI